MLGSDQSGSAGGGGSELERLWSLLSELSAQLSHNRQQTEDLHRRADELKTQAIHTQTGFTLRRFNTDITKEEFESELERLNVTLVLENQSLQQENRQLSSLLKDYEGTLESVMGKFRAHAYATQSHHLDLTRHYESILLALPSTSLPLQQTSLSLPSPNTTELSLTSQGIPLVGDSGGQGGGGQGENGEIDPLHLSLSLAHLSTLIRKALRSLGGEEPEEEDGDDERGEEELGGGGGGEEEKVEKLSEIESIAEEKEEEEEESLLTSTTTAPTTTTSNESTSTSSHTPSPSTSTSLEPSLLPSTFTSQPQSHKRDLSTGGYIGLNASTNPHYQPTTSTSSLVASPPKDSPTSNHTTLTKMKEWTKDRERREELLRNLGPLDRALEEESELLGVRRENEGLRRLLFGMQLEELVGEQREGGGEREVEGGSGI